MKKTIYFKHNGGKKMDSGNPIAGWLAVGDHAIHGDKTHLLCCECVTALEFEEQAERLKGLIDAAVAAARKKLP
jgi:hypothetical protein